MSGRFYPDHTPWSRRRRRRPRWRWLLPLVVVAISGATVGAFHAFFTQPLTGPDVQIAQGHADTPPPIETPAPPGLMEHLTSAFPGRRFLTVLLMGVDEIKVRGRTDTMILLLLDLRKQRMGAINIPRDTRVSLPRHGEQKINAAYVYGGAEMAKQATGGLLGCRVDYYVKTNIEGFVRMVDLVGGVQLNVEKRMRYRDRAQGLSIRLDPGEQLLDGEKAMQYVRFRHDRMGDLGRIRRQQTFLRALAEQALQGENLRHLPALIEHLPDALETDFSLIQVKALFDLFGQVSFAEVPTLQLPVHAEMSGAYFLVANPKAARGLLDDLMASLREDPPDIRLAISSPPEHAALRAEAQRRLKTAGFPLVSGPVDPVAIPQTDTTTILDPEHHYFLSRRIQRILGAGSVQEEIPDHMTSEDADVTIIVGPDVPWAPQDADEVL